MSLIKIVPLENAGSTLKELARSKGMNKGLVTEKSGINANTLSRINTDDYFTRDQLIAYAQAIGIGRPYVIFAVDEEDVKRLLNIQQ